MFLPVQNNLFDGAQNVASQFFDSSGVFTLVRASSAVITVQTSITTGGTTCDYNTYATAAINAAIAAGYSPETAYHYRYRRVPKFWTH